MKAVLIVLVVLIIIALLFGSSFISRRNQMAIKREAVNASWAQVDVVLQRRADLIPNLVETVKGFATHETEVFSDIAKAREGYMNATTPADKIAANTRKKTQRLRRMRAAGSEPPHLPPVELFSASAASCSRASMSRSAFVCSVQRRIAAFCSAESPTNSIPQCSLS